jgi:hypothetical protein
LLGIGMHAPAWYTTGDDLLPYGEPGGVLTHTWGWSDESMALASGVEHAESE